MTQRKLALMLIATVALLVPMLIFLLNYQWVRYAVDDYCQLSLSRDLGAVGATVYYYFSLTGRFAAMFATFAIEPMGLGPIQVLSAVLFLLWWLALTNIFASLARHRQLAYPSICGIAASSFIILITLSSLPNIAQPIYWQIGVWTYFVSVISLTLALWLVVQQRLGNRLTLVLCGVLCFISAGFADLFIAIHIIILASACFFTRKKPERSRLFQRFAACTIGIILGSIIAFTAPGNFVRNAALTIPLDFSLGIFGSIFSPILTEGISVLVSPFTAIALIILSAVFAYHFDPSRMPPLRRVPLVIVAGLCLSIAYYSAFFFLHDLPMPPRAWIEPQLFVACGVALISYMVGLRLKTVSWSMPRVVSYLAAILFLALIGASTSRALAVNEQLRNYAAVWESEDKFLRGISDKSQTVTIAAPPEIFNLEKLSSDKTFWINTCMAKYYQVSGIVAAPSE